MSRFSLTPFARPVVAAMTLLLILASLAPLPLAREGAIAAAVLATAMQFMSLSRMARLFAVLAVLAYGLATRLPPARLAEVQLALWQGIAFAALLSMLGLMRAPIRRSALVSRAASYLAGFPVRYRYSAINFGSHFLSLLFNVGIIALIGTFLRAGAREPAGEVPNFRHMLLAGVRGTALMTIWSPMSLGFAITTTAIAGLDPVRFLCVAFASTLVLLVLTCLVLRGGAEEESHPARAERGSAAPLGLILLASAVLLGAAVLLHERFGLGFIVSTVVVVPAFALVWTLADPGTPALPLGRRIGALFVGIGDMRTEAAIFLSANVIGATLSALIRETPAWDALQGGAYPVLPVLIACLALVPLAGAAFIPHSIFVVLIAQLLGSSPLGATHPMALGLTLSFGWALGISISPLSAMSLIAGSLAGVPSHVVSLVWNRRFVLLLFAASAAIICGVTVMGY